MNSLTTYWLCRAPGADPEGPLTLGQLKEMYGTGAIHAEALVCRNGEEEWTGIDGELNAGDVECGSPVPAERRRRVGKKKRKSKAGCGPAVLFLLGIGLCVVFWPVGVLMVLLALLLDHVSYYRACSLCGNEVAKRSRLCPACGAVLK